MNPTRIFGNNCEFNYKNSASPTLCIKVRNTIITPRITQILGMTNHTGDPLNFKYFFKIWPVIETIPVPFQPVWNNLRDECLAMNYEQAIYERLLDVNSKITPMIGKSVCQFSFNDLANIMGITHYDGDYNSFLWVFRSFIMDPQVPQNPAMLPPGFNYYNNILNLSLAERDSMRQIENQVKFKCIILPCMNDSVTLRTYFLDLNETFHNNYQDAAMQTLYATLVCRVLYSVYEGISILQNHEIVHNDLHLGNIFVKTNDESTFIYDFDRSYCQPVGQNPMLTNNPCTGVCTYGQCNISDPFTDCFKIMLGIVHNFQNRGATRDQALLIIFRILFNGTQDAVITNFIRILLQNQFFTDNTGCCYLFNPASPYAANIQNIRTIMGANPVTYILNNLSIGIGRLMGQPARPVVPIPLVPIPVVNNTSANPRWYFQKLSDKNKIDKNKMKSEKFKMNQQNDQDNDQINKNKIKKEKMNPMTGKKSPEYWVKMLSDIGKKGYKNPFLTQSTPFGDIITENDFIKYPPGSINTNYKKIFS
jgi:hypothetical protein